MYFNEKLVMETMGSWKGCCRQNPSCRYML